MYIMTVFNWGTLFMNMYLLAYAWVLQAIEIVWKHLIRLPLNQAALSMDNWYDELPVNIP